MRALHENSEETHAGFKPSWLPTNMPSKTKRVSGLIVDHHRSEQNLGGWIDAYRVGDVWYYHRTCVDEPRMRLGDLVRFEARRCRIRGRGVGIFIIDVFTVELTDLAVGKEEGGYVYVLSNPAMPGLCKVGVTWGTPESRARGLSRPSGVPTPFVVESSLWVNRDPKRVEKVVHGLLADSRRAKEFFRVSPQVATSAVQWAHLRCSRGEAGGRSAVLSERERIHDRARRGLAFLRALWGDEATREHLEGLGFPVDFDETDRFMPQLP